MALSLRAQVRRWFAGPGWLGVPVAALGGVWVVGAEGISSTTGFQGIGPGVMVRGVGIALVVLGLLLAVSSWVRPAPAAPHGAGNDPGDGVDGERESEGQVNPDQAPPTAPQWRLLALALVAMLVPPLTLPWLSFPLVAMVAFALVARAFGSRRLLVDLLIGLTLGGLAWWGFSALGISLGPLLPQWTKAAA